MTTDRRRFFVHAARRAAAAAATCTAAVPLVHAQAQSRPTLNGFDLSGALVPLPVATTGR